MSKKIRYVVFAYLCCYAFFFPNYTAAECTNYGDKNNWAYFGDANFSEHEVDIFFVAPTVFLGSNLQYNMPIDDVKSRMNFLGATNMEKGIYDVRGSFYAPYYQQVGLTVYQLDADVAAPYFELAYQDVKAAFEYYVKERNNNRPIVLAGFSQGADMIIRLMKDKYSDPKLQEKLVAAYVIGWRVTPEEVARYPQLKMAQGEYDTGVIISYNTEAPDVTTSFLVPDRTLAINPLNWKTTGEVADKTLNKGAVFVGYDGNSRKEIPNLTGAFLNGKRGTLKVTDISSAEYPSPLAIFAEGVYHIYDYQFFYRNLQQNVEDRINNFQKRQAFRQAS